jgi:alpha/beta superfamily hydrolase
VAFDLNRAPDAQAVALLLHPHPDFGGNRFHPFVGGLYQRLPEVGVTTVRFDFGSGDPEAARRQASAVLDEVATDGAPVVLAGYSFGAGVAASIEEERIAAWFLLAPQTDPLSRSEIGSDPRPKAIVVPERDQFSPPAAIAAVVAGWTATTLTTAAGADHFLGAITDQLVETATEWIAGLVSGA